MYIYIYNQYQHYNIIIHNIKIDASYLNYRLKKIMFYFLIFWGGNQTRQTLQDSGGWELQIGNQALTKGRVAKFVKFFLR